MAKTSSIEKNNRRRKLVAQHAAKRKRLKAIADDLNRPAEERFAARLKLAEMPRNQERSFCCGAGGARMWMEETIGTRVNENRTDEALAQHPDLVTAACPYCLVMLSDGVALRRQQGQVGEEVEVTDVSEVLLRSVRSPE